ncbi:hypothetical protein IVB69_13290 [Flavobacterium sp. J49]|uniref:hypothetical protein n=1 Tax=Flavobacterium sp. J49 TaxID=2718534 RepID=UPI001592DFAF|nr:hypothetical protein [Flavobacterium sp. J49]MBF6642459.1 hypothetical protein [Flavobacterium sp. J49]NIC03705.1 hypothetical protein [Flavobacterium sp. J49]
MKFLFFLFLSLFLTSSGHAQSDLQTAIKGGEILLTGLSIFKTAKSGKSDSKIIESVCVKNKLVDKITFKIVGKDEQGDEIKKELVIQKDGKECLFILPKGIYTYEIILPNKEIYKKGEYKFNEEVVITIKDD